MDTNTIADFENNNILNIELIIETYNPYIYTILKNIISNSIDIENLIETNEKSKIILNALDNMKEEEKKIFIMFYYKSQKIKEIAKQMNISQGKIKTVLHRTRKVIKKKLKERGYDYGK